MVTRRRLLAAGAAGGAAVLVTAGSPASGRAPAEAAPLDAHDIPKYVSPLRIPPAMPPVATGPERDTYVIAVRQFRQQILPPSWPRTTVWGYGSTAHPGSFGYPAPSIVARVGHPVRVTWVNQLVDSRGDYLPHLLPVDPTLHWANPPGGTAHRDRHGSWDGNPRGYRGPVPQVVHLHGGHSTQESDGHSEAWYLPAARDLPRDFAVAGSAYREFRSRFAERFGLRWAPGSATFEYANDQRPCTLWYHDHSLGLTRENVYAGPAGFYLLGGGDDLPDGVLPGPAPARHDPPDARYHDIPLLIQDRSFTADGDLLYPDAHTTGGETHSSRAEAPPIWVSRFSGSTMVVNGRTWPTLTVQRRRYRFRLLNGCNSRFLLLSVAANATARPARPVLPVWQIGSDGGFLPEPVPHERVALGPAQRVDAIVDFTDVPAGTELYLVNEGPDGAYGGGRPGVDFAPADPRTTGQVLRFVVVDAAGADLSVPPEQLRLPSHPRLGPAQRVRRLSLNERMSSSGSMAMLLGVLDDRGRGLPLRWSDPVTEQPTLDSTEVWEVRNFTRHMHPVHLHQVQFELLGRGHSGRVRPDPGDRGRMDTVRAYPWEVTRIKAHFDLPGRYAWHCHLLEHEDNEMMRPLTVLPRGGAAAGDGGPPGGSVAPGTASTDAG
ncbi:multicopper oxidase family protein [Micromonospora zamorensis]|uniref:multicopper oxidase family protein n=1 Tax=Micromonospora zamorensis TaxID=709883 RepID=UPI0036887610